MSENEHCCAQLCSQRISEMIVCGINTYNTYMSVFFIHPASGHVGSTFARFPHILEIMTWRRAIHSQYHGVGYQHRQYNRFSILVMSWGYSDLDWNIWVANLANCFVIICDCDVCVILCHCDFKRQFFCQVFSIDWWRSGASKRPSRPSRPSRPTKCRGTPIWHP